MFNSFLIILRANDDGELQNSLESIYDSLKEIIMKSNIKYDKRLLLKSFTITNFLNEKFYNCKIVNGKKYTIRVSTLLKDTYAVFTSYLIKKVLLKKEIKVSNVSFRVMKVIYNPIMSKWVDSFSVKEIDNILYDDFNLSKINITYLRPAIFKIGDKFYSNISSELIFKDLVKKFNKFCIYKIPKDKLMELYRIKHKIKEQKMLKIKLSKTIIESKLASVEFLIDDLDEETKKIAFILLKFATFSGIGYKTEHGYGQIILE